MACARHSTIWAASRGCCGTPCSRLRQSAAVDIFQRKERQLALLADLVNLHDVGVLKAGDGLRFAEEAHHLFGRGVAGAEDHLEGDEAMEADLPRLVDDAHAAAAEHSRI